MVDEITNGMLLQHIHAMKNSLELQIETLDKKLCGRMDRLEGRIGGLEGRIGGLEAKMDRGFEEARQHRQALQEDLEATMRMLARHDRKLAKI